MAEKSQFMALVEVSTMDRLDALRLVMGVSRARVAEQAMVGGGLNRLERTHTERLERLYRLAGAQQRTWQELVREYAKRNARVTYGQTLEELEQGAGITAPSPA